MAVKRTVIAALVGQFGHGVQPTDRVLEISFGPGLARALSRCAGGSGRVSGTGRHPGTRSKVRARAVREKS